MTVVTLKEFAALFDRSAARVRPELEIALKKLGVVVAKTAKKKLGHYNEGWESLAERTIEDKEAKGFPTPSPLLRTGTMRASIKEHVTGLTLEVGSNDKIAVYQELGTSRGIPPRPFLKTAMLESEPEVGKLFLALAERLLTGKVK
jgi:hypothetical protein